MQKHSDQENCIKSMVFWAVMPHRFLDTVSEDSVAPNFWVEAGGSSDHG